MELPIQKDERLALLSALQELSIAALDLFDPERPVSEFLIRLAERMDCTAVVCAELDPQQKRVEVLGTAGISSAALKLPIDVPPEVDPLGRVDWASLALPYPELGIRGVKRWTIPLGPDGRAIDSVLYVYHRMGSVLPPAIRGTLMRLARVLQTSLSYRRMYAQLHRETSLLHNVSDAAMEGIVVVSPDRRVLFRTRRMLESWGLGSVEVGEPAQQLLERVGRRMKDPRRFLTAVAHWRDTPLAEGKEEFELRDGRTVEVRSVPIVTARRGELARGWYFRDVTARKQVDQTRHELLMQERRARAAAEQGVRERDEFLSMAAHELRTPVTRMMLRLDAMGRSVRSGRPPDPAVAEKLRDSFRKLTSLVDDLLDFSRVRAGRLPIDLQPCELCSLVDQVVDSFRAVSAKHELVMERVEANLWVRADPSRLEQVFGNLLENAIKYSPRGGRIEVKVGDQDGRAMVSVTDPGIGIPADEQERLFGRFFRAANASARNFAGLGLGLYLARDIVNRHGGEISVRSEEGKGSTFSVFLPLMARAETHVPEEGAGLPH